MLPISVAPIRMGLFRRRTRCRRGYDPALILAGALPAYDHTGEQGSQRHDDGPAVLRVRQEVAPRDGDQVGCTPQQKLQPQ